MKQISEQQIQKRWDVLPENLKEALFFEQNADIVWTACEAQHIPDYKIETIAIIVGDVILGFIHPEELAKEIQNSLNLNINIANEIAKEVDRKIFSLIKGDLEQIYAPPALEVEKESTIDLRYKQFDILGKTDEPKLINITEEAGYIAPNVKIEKQKMDFNISRNESLEAPAEISEAVKQEGEVAPMIIHQQSEFKPTIALKSSLGGLFGLRRKGAEPAAPQPIVAQVSLSPEEDLKKDEPKTASTEKPKVKIVHYSDFTVPKDVFGKDESDANIQMRTNDANEIRMDINKPSQEQEIKKTDIEEPKINPIPIKPGELIVNLKDFGGLNNNEEIKEINLRDTNLQVRTNDANETRINPEKKELNGNEKEIVNDFKMPETNVEIKKPGGNNNHNNNYDHNKGAGDKGKNIGDIGNIENKPEQEKKEEIKLEDIPVGGDAIDLRSL
ncbi:MAG: hypothetical protein QMD86_01560 [Patescibacteria group bacterium]|nr:hypothetical protein [Patescibacteria group bacterium]